MVCLAKVIGHLKFFTVPVHHISTCTAWAEVQEGALGTHDVWVLLAPLGLASNLDDRIGILVDSYYSEGLSALRVLEVEG